MITTTLVSSRHWKSLEPFYLRKKRPENTILKPAVNSRTFILKKFIPSKATVNWLLNNYVT